VLSQLGEPAAAEEHLVQAVRLKPDSAEARNNLGAFWVRTGHLDQALAVLTERPCASSRSSPRPDTTSAWVLTAQGKLDQAIAELQKAVSIDPSYADAHHTLGVALEGRNEIEAAVGEYRTRAAAVAAERALQDEPGRGPGQNAGRTLRARDLRSRTASGS
jgi:Tfp pilus assembly protein PilF